MATLLQHEVDVAPPAYSEMPSANDVCVKDISTAIEAVGATSPALRDPTSLSVLNARPATEFGWQLALQKHGGTVKGSLSGASQGTPEDAKAPAVEGLSEQAKVTFSSNSPPDTASDADSRLGLQESEPAASLARHRSRVRRFKSKDIGWQLALQAPEDEPQLSGKPAESQVEDTGAGDALVDIWGTAEKDSTAKDGALAGTAISYPSLSLDLERAALEFSSFAVEGEKRAPAPRSADGEGGPQSARPVASGSGTADDQPFAPTFPRQPSARYPSSDWQNGESVYVHGPADDPGEIVTLQCMHCDAMLEVASVVQISFCDHLVCLECLRAWALRELAMGQVPSACLVCTSHGRLVAQSGTVTGEALGNCSLDPTSSDVLQELQLADHSTRVSCPSCNETMLIDSVQYSLNSIIVCPLNGCAHAFCKRCLQPGPSGSAQHKCGKMKGWKPCPGCGTMGQRLIPTNNHIRCKGLGCRIHFCYGCGRVIGNGLRSDDIDQDVLQHFRRCSKSEKSGKCIIM